MISKLNVVVSAVVILSAGVGVFGSANRASAGGWAVGAGGTILHCEGFGQPWVQQTSGTNKNLRGIFFQDASHGWIAGDHGTLLSTDNGGATWSPHSTSPISDFREVCFSDSQNGWISGWSEQVFRTTDGGATWTLLPASTFYNNGSAGTTVGSHFFDSQHGWMAFFGQPLFETVDGGATWNARTPAELFLDASFIDQNHIWASTDNGLLMHTDDGGDIWQTQSLGDNSIYQVDFVNPACGWIGSNPWYLISHTADGGQSWAGQMPGMADWATAISFADENHGWVFADRTTVRYTSDGGATFTTQSLPTSQFINEAVWVVPEPSTVVLLGFGVIGLFGWARKRSGKAG